MIRPFTVNAGDDRLSDLKARISNTRWPDTISESSWADGADIQYMKELADYWLNEFDWRKTEHTINNYSNFIATINGYNIHFIHVKSKSKKVIPLIITHGWPYSFLEMLKLIPLLCSGEELAFDLVIPSMLGYGFSQKVTTAGCNSFLMADLWHELMIKLGYTRYGVQGGDFGAGISAAISFKYPGSVRGMHLNYIPGIYEPLPDHNDLSDEEKEYLANEDKWYYQEGGYSHQQRTKPQTLAFALNDSPVGLCSWIIEKIREWADCKGNPESVFTKDELLSNVTLYWLTQTIHSSIRLYKENSKIRLNAGNENKIRVPAGIARFRLEEPFPPRSYVERGFMIMRWTEFDSGGHFPAMEKPELLAGDIREFFRSLPG